ncbi:two-component system sensor histidine kinase KdpD [Streptacidiphilus sp. MAP12-33]|uniref:sensor histidine kinase n=1 Tax=Streptacidiphilus sp. MAP12-33 TaxID=3156266 RepID=UPI00351689E0
MTEPRAHVRSVPGRLKVYLGAAPGVGKTFRMLDEAHRRAARGTDVVIGLVECHGRPRTEERLVGLEAVPRLERDYRGTRFTEMDTDAVLARRPEVAVIDELAHTNIPGGRYAKRWQDVEELLAAGIDVLTTVNVQHLESLNDVVQKITGVPQRETVPDEVVRRADQIELVDMPPEGLRRRMVHGNVYGPEKVDAALSNYFRVGNLTALRELALLWVAGRVDEGLQRYRAEHGIGGVWETKERVVVALTGGPEGETLIRRAARIAARSAGGELLAVHVARSDGLTDSNPAALAAQRQLVESIGGSYHSVVGDDIPQALIDFARAENATQLVLGTSRRSKLSRSLTGIGIGEAAVALSGDIDVHMVTHEAAGRGRHQRPTGASARGAQRLAGPVAAVVVPVLLTLVLTQARHGINLTSDTLLYLAAVVGVALFGGMVSALVASVAASLLLNYYFIPPIHRFTVQEPNNVLALVILVAVALVVAMVVDRAAQLAQRAARATAEAETLSVLTHDVLGGEETIPALLTRLRETFGMDRVTLITRDRTGAETVLSTDTLTGTSAGSARHGAVDEEVAVTDDAALVLRGRPLPAADRRVLTAFAAHVRAALDRARLAHAAAEAAPTQETHRTRAALLSAVSHDLRDPLAAALTAVGALRTEEENPLSPRQEQLLGIAEESLERLAQLAEDLHDLSRLHTGVLVPRPERTDPAEAFAAVSEELADSGPVLLRQRGLDNVPPVDADPTLLERVLANLVADAVEHCRGAVDGTEIVVAGSTLGNRVEVRVVDHGPSLRPGEADRLFEPAVPFYGGATPSPSSRAGATLHLALAHGFADCMGATLTPEDTPGGGLTMVLDLPAWQGS